MARKSNQQSLGEILEEFLKQNKLGGKLQQSEIISSWEDIAGSMIAKHTKKIFFMDQKLVIEIDSPSLKNELGYIKTALVEKINKFSGKTLITELVIR